MPLITIAIHSPQKALELKSLLESEGIKVSLQNVDLNHPIVSVGIRVRIDQNDLPLALRIIEHTDIFRSCNIEGQETIHPIVVPVDCSNVSFKACREAFELAQQHNAGIVLLHSYLGPSATTNFQLSDALTFDIAVDAETRRQVEFTAHAQLKNFAEKLRKKMIEGELPTVKMDLKVMEGVPEDVIIEYAKVNPPYLVVMGTRAASRKVDEMIGSVTAEVMDKGRFSVLTVPEPFDKPLQPQNILLFSNLESEDLLAVDTMSRIFPDIRPNVTVVHVPGRRVPFGTNIKKSMESMLEYCKSTYGAYTFDMEEMELSRNAFQSVKELVKSRGIDLIIIPNKRKNIFARMINSALPSRILYTVDVPMLVIRV